LIKLRSISAGLGENEVELPPVFLGGSTLAGPVRRVVELVGHVRRPEAGDVVVTGMNEAADTMGFIAVYPKSNAQNEWAMACDRCSPNAAIGVGDVHYFRVVVDALPKILPVDPDRIFLSGFSNGGMMTYRAACTLADEIAGFASNGAGMWTWHLENCEPTRAVPILMINGTADGQFPWDGVAVNAPLVGGRHPSADSRTRGGVAQPKRMSGHP
jgi:poly(3-hydroxybutyrate) depolymerase